MQNILKKEMSSMTWNDEIILVMATMRIQIPQI